MTRMAFCDLETFSETPIRNGTFRYAENSEVLLFTYALKDEEPQVWDVAAKEPMPATLKYILNTPDITLCWHNFLFDTSVLEYVMNIHIPSERLWCTMAQALAHSLPGSLATLCSVMGVKLENAKSAKGHDLVRLFCMPRPGNSKIRRLTRDTNPAEWEEFKRYACSDIKAMRAIHHKMPTWNYRGSELELWRLDRQINKRGMLVDRELAGAAINAVAKAQAGLSADVSNRSSGVVGSATQRDKLLAFILSEHGVTLPDLQKSTIERRLNDENLPQEVKELLAIRLEASMSSTSKYAALMKAVNDDGRLRGTLQFCGASRTGRTAGRIVQPQNFPRPTLPNKEIEYGIDIIKSGAAHLLLNNVIEVASNAIRGLIIAPEGKKLVVSDLSNIEGRFAAWVSEEEWKVKAFSDFDKGIGDDLYKLDYARAFGVDVKTVTKDQRQIGKTLSLSMGYGGSVGAFVTFATAFNTDLDAMAAAALPSIPDRIKLEALGFYDWLIKQERPTFDLTKETYIVCECLKRLWREANPNIVSMWSALQDAFKQVIAAPGQTVIVRKVKIRKDGSWVRLILPSGRSLCYPSARIDEKGQISYMGINSYSRKWDRIRTFGGKLLENCFTGDTLVYTLEGLKPIIKVTQKDKVWDGYSWVSTRGYIYSGKRKIVTWLGIKLTPDHKIFNGVSMKPMIDLGENGVQDALMWALKSARLLSSLQQKKMAVEPYVGASAAVKNTFSFVNYGENKVLDARIVLLNRYLKDLLNTPIFLRMLKLKECGLIDTPGWYVDVTQRIAENTKTTALAGLPFIKNGLKIENLFLDTQKPYAIGKTYPWIWTEQITTKGTNPGISASLVDKRIAEIEMPPATLVTKKLNTVTQSLSNFFYRIGKVLIVFITILSGVNPLNGLWKNITKTEKVYDLVNCGPLHRFMIQTTSGPLVVSNCTQAGSRDVFMNALQPAWDVGYETILHIHDEIIAETPDNDNFTAEGLSKIMATNPVWAEGLPLAAGGFSAKRYKKSD